MVAAGLATGNAVVFKPAEQTPLCGFVLVEALRDAGVPPDALGLLQGNAETGAALVRDPRVATIAFTGSSPTGLDILAATGDVVPGQRQLKRAIVDMGGKNCIIVDEDADLEAAIEPIVHSAFAYAGQKCSTASRLLVHEAVADELIERVAAAVEALEVGAPEAFGTVVGPVIDRRAQARVAHYARQAAASGRVVAHRLAQERPERGWYCPPIVVADVDPRAAVLRDEVLGPLLTIERVLSIDDACHAHRRAPLRPDRRPVLPQPGHRRARRRAHAGRQPVRQPRDHRRRRRPPALRRQPAVGHRHQGRWPGLPAALRRAARRDRERMPPPKRTGASTPTEDGDRTPAVS